VRKNLRKIEIQQKPRISAFKLGGSSGIDLVNRTKSDEH